MKRIRSFETSRLLKRRQPLTLRKIDIFSKLTLEPHVWRRTLSDCFTGVGTWSKPSLGETRIRCFFFSHSNDNILHLFTISVTKYSLLLRYRKCIHFCEACYILLSCRARQQIPIGRSPINCMAEVEAVWILTPFTQPFLTVWTINGFS